MFEEHYIQYLAAEHYGIKVEVKALPGYDEINYRVQTADRKPYILKLVRAEDNLELLHAQAHMMGWLHRAIKDSFPRFLKSVKGERIVEIDSPEGDHYYLRILHFLPGTFYAEKNKHSAVLQEHVGTFLGRMDRQLEGFNHWGAHRYMDWDIQHVLDWEEETSAIRDPADRRLVLYFMLQFSEIVQPRIARLRHAVIHNDANDWNILVGAGGDKVTGLIDFGDLVYAPLINNLAVAVTYVVLYSDTPIIAASRVVQGYHNEYALTETEVDLLYYLIAARLCLSLAHSAKQRESGSANEHHFLTEKRAWRLLHQWIQINPVKFQQALRKVCGFQVLYQQGADYKEILERRKHFIGKNLSVSYRKKLKIERGALQYLYDDQGHTYLDCVNNVSHVGHCHPTVVKAMQRQLATLNTNTRYLHDALEEYAEAICATLPEELGVCYFVNSGSEANDLAVRMARHYTGHKDIVVLDSAYHGTSTLALEMSPYKFDGKGGFPQPSYIHKAWSPDPYRGKFRYKDERIGEKYAGDIKRITDELGVQGKYPAAFICETLLGVGGQIPLPEGYLKEAYKNIRSAGGVAIADEVQVGFGRVGKAFWGFQLQDVVPDIVVMGKPIGNGHPLAAVVVKPEIAEAFNNGMEYFNTFGGNPVSMKTGLAVLQVIKEEELRENALQVGLILKEGLHKLQQKYAFIGDVRGVGLFVGAEFIKDSKTLKPEVELLNEAIEMMRNRGFLLSTDGPLHNVLKIKPPLVFSTNNAEDLIQNLDAVLSFLT